jgi:hypothetical protein
MSNVSVETVIRIWDDDHGYRWEVAEDGDAMGMVSIKYIEDGNKPANLEMSFPEDVARQIAVGIMRHLDDRKRTSQT